MKGGAATAEGSPVSVFGLLGYLSEQVPALSEEYYGRPQYPIYSTQGQDFPLFVPVESGGNKRGPRSGGAPPATAEPSPDGY